MRPVHAVRVDKAVVVLVFKGLHRAPLLERVHLLHGEALLGNARGADLRGDRHGADGRGGAAVPHLSRRQLPEISTNVFWNIHFFAVFVF